MFWSARDCSLNLRQLMFLRWLLSILWLPRIPAKIWPLFRRVWPPEASGRYCPVHPAFWNVDRGFGQSRQNRRQIHCACRWFRSNACYFWRPRFEGCKSAQGNQDTFASTFFWTVSISKPKRDYCVLMAGPKVANFRKTFASRVKDKCYLFRSCLRKFILF